MKKKRISTIVLALILSVATTSVAFGFEEWEYIGWVNSGSPKYTWSYVDGNNLISCPEYLTRNDVFGSNIMARLRKSYTLINRASKIRNAQYMQKKLWADEYAAEDRSYTSKTYYQSPYGLGYTEWYDSPSGLFLDYAHQYARYRTDKDKAKDIDKDIGVDVVRDSIYYNKVRYPYKETRAFVATNNSALADAKTGSILQRNGKNYPVYLNNDRTLDRNVKEELIRRGIKDLYLLGGQVCFDYTAGVTEGFNIIRVGGLNREHTKELMLKMPSKMETPQHYEGDNDGYVMLGVPESYKSMVKTYLSKEKESKNGKNLIECARNISKMLKIGTEPNISSLPVMTIGINDNSYEAYWIVYWNENEKGYVYQFVLNGYYSDVSIDCEITSINGSNVYKQNNSTYWTSLNSDVNINTRGTTNVKDDMEGIRLNLYSNSFSSVGNSPCHTMTPSNISANNFVDLKNNTSSKAKLDTYKNKRAITGQHTIRATKDDMTYNLYTSACIYDWSDYKNSGMSLKTDGIAPTGAVNDDLLDLETGKTKIVVSDIVEKGSGVQRIWAEYSDVSSSKKASEILVASGNTYIGGKKVTDLLGNDVKSFNLKIYAIDNVGNKSELLNKKVDVMNIKANITRVLEPHEPIFKEGEKGILHINTFGGVEKVKITFPYQLSAIDDTLNRELTLNCLPQEDVEVEFFIPLGAENKEYKVQVIGYKNGKEMEVYPKFEVKGSILNQIRTRVRVRDK